ncbi:RHS repeat domain-containing protein [Moritella viscosa]|uniref:RHS repeat domain-containing protein n=1 Tax=Moritella viscosa TaxID=80854 RepID=UPI00091F2FA0|nr:RHS repeat-associated core domain-containing protein [Moritella viscosa]SHO10391.1 Putative uncharacterized protein [Moritella viscosa]SHO10406.1 Putative uncharacterized protein [Moritella viscosa]SHO15594.1 Putative uncharacterized protein [Moritella viscosa]SHO17422.1 Putative uncharacterized protein [Moritella viscosa]
MQHKQFIYAGGKLIALNTQAKDSAHKLVNKQVRYLHYDALDSVDVITDGYGSVVEHRSFDPWGKMRSVLWEDDSVTNIAQQLITNCGFTGHEHIEEVGLIHMNGRVYDQELGRFLSADPFVQSPFMTNSFNRYSYVMNNPLKYTDPTGFGEIKALDEITTQVVADTLNAINEGQLNPEAMTSIGLSTAAFGIGRYIDNKVLGPSFLKE